MTQKRTMADIYQPVSMDRVDVGLGRLEDAFENLYNTDTDPDYQRGHVWTLEQQRRYVGYIVQGGQNRPLIINEGPKGNGVGWPGRRKEKDYTFQTELVDGKQRYRALTNWMNGMIAARLYDNSVIHIEELEDDAQSMRLLTTTIRIRLGMVQLNREQTLRYYLRLNGGGTAHSDDELERVRLMLEKGK